MNYKLIFIIINFVISQIKCKNMHIINTFRNYCKKKIQFFQKDMRILSTFAAGKMAEWSIASVLKTDDCNRSGGSNPSLSAKNGSIPLSSDIHRIRCHAPQLLPVAHAPLFRDKQQILFL